MDSILSKLGIDKEFDVIVTGDQIENGKPNPETYVKVLGHLNINPKEAIVFEDAESGIKAAKAAGAWCIAVKGNRQFEQDTELADASIDSFDEATFEFIKSSKFID